MNRQQKRVLVVGGAGYVGAVLVPKLLKQGYRVRVLDLFIYGEDIFDSVNDASRLEIIKGDIRKKKILSEALNGVDAVIHLACISNDPSYELDPELGKSINYDAFVSLVDLVRQSDVTRFIYASSSSVYGIKEGVTVTEDLSLEPLTDYSKYKVKCEQYLLSEDNPGMAVTIIRPATVCGYSPRMRFDLTVNILTNHAINNGKITVFGGEQKRPNLHIEDMTDLYVFLLTLPKEKIDRKIYNAGYQNQKVKDIAAIVKKTLNSDVEVITTPTDDNRSYHISAQKIADELGFIPKHTIEDAVKDLELAFQKGMFEDPMNNPVYFNVKMMNLIKLT